MSIVDHLACSPGTAGLPLEDSLGVFSDIGFRNMELFCRGASAPDLHADPEAYRSLAARYGVRISSFHLPNVSADLARSFEWAVHVARFGESDLRLQRGIPRRGFSVRGECAEVHIVAVFETVQPDAALLHRAGDSGPGFDAGHLHERLDDPGERLASLLDDEEDQGEVDGILGDARGEARVVEDPERALLEEGDRTNRGGFRIHEGRAPSSGTRTCGARGRRGAGR